ncbi:MAG: hypothetical protein FWD48_03435 [Oscillospiraceae bacterium]|nr:hypothetical protein [Oscillospiraceae bacterium]
MFINPLSDSTGFSLKPQTYAEIKDDVITFSDVLSESLKNLTSNYDRLISHYGEMFNTIYFHEHDLSTVQGYNRSDFPKSLLFKNDININNLSSIELPDKIPADISDITQSRWRDISKQNGVVINIHPNIIEKMEQSDEYFYTLMYELSKMLNPDSFNELRRYENYYIEKSDIGGYITDMSIIVTIDENGKIEKEWFTTGQNEIKDIEERKISRETKEELIEINYNNETQTTRRLFSLNDCINETIDNSFIYDYNGVYFPITKKISIDE